MRQLWTEEYRPDTLDGYVFKDQQQKEQVQAWVKSNAIPHLLFSGAAGVGKTTLAKILIKALNIDSFDLLEINASRENSVDTIRDKITNFVSTMPFGDFKIVLLDECDYITPNGQAALRGVMEMYAESSRFILTCNYPNRVIPALHSRCQGFHIDKIDHTEFTARVAEVLIEETVEFDLDTLDSYVKATYPDLRKCLNMLQMNSVEGKLIEASSGTASTSDYKLKTVEHFKKGEYTAGRKLFCAQTQADDVEGMFGWLYNNIELWGDTDDAKDQAIVVIRDGLAKHTLVADAEINMAATIIQLCDIKRG